MKDDYNDFLTAVNDSPTDPKSRQNRVNRALEILQGEDYKQLLDTIAIGYIYDRINAERSFDKTSTNDMIYPQVKQKVKQKVYVFGINNFLKHANDAALDALTTIADITKFKIRPAAQAGDTLYAATVSWEFLSAIKPLLRSRIKGVEDPGIVFSAKGAANLRRGINTFGKVDVTEELSNTFVNDMMFAQNIISKDKQVIGESSMELLSLDKESVKQKIRDLEAHIMILSKDPDRNNDLEILKEAVVKLDFLRDTELVRAENVRFDKVLHSELFGEDYKEHKQAALTVLRTIIMDYNPKETENSSRKGDAMFNAEEFLIGTDPSIYENVIAYKEDMIEQIAVENEGLETILRGCIQ